MQKTGHAVVIGGSIAGLLAARVLTDYAERITIIERDQYPDQPHSRKGVPQGRHVHTLLMRGSSELEQLFPGIRSDLTAAGAVSIDWMYDCIFFGLGGWAPRFHSALTGYCCTRDLLEYVLRQRLAAFPAIRYQTNTDVVGLVATEDNQTITGVQLRRRGMHPANETEPTNAEVLPADLVIDASGRDSKAPQWFESLGYAKPAETTVNSYLGYASRIYQKPAVVRFDWKLALLRALPPSTRGGVIYPVEGERWAVTLGGAGRDYPPTDEEGFLAYARSLASPLIADAITQAEPLTAIAGYQRTINRWRHYELLERQPARFLVVGDAVCAFNPIYGQGMTAAALGARALQQVLQQAQGNVDSIARQFPRALAASNQTLWLLATSEDFRYPGTEGTHPGRITRLTHRYMDRLARHAAHSPQLHQAFIEVIHLLKPPPSLFHPRVIAKVLTPLPSMNINPL
jgi:2-polyprenyl-6-methoxyphenol hydroxylase-like FAD-dependent oxidoreductase